MQNRTLWIDYLRSFITVLVVAHHSSLAYTTFASFDKVQLHGHTVRGVRCYLTGEETGNGGFDVARFRIRDKHGLDHHVFNQKFNIHLSDGRGTDVETLLLGKRQAELAGFEAEAEPAMS